MDIDSSEIQQLINYPGESLKVELKRWISPDTDEGQAKIIKASIAFRNFNGGYLIIGFDGTTLAPDTTNIPANVRTDFHIDKIQGIISRYSSELFEIFVEFPERNGQEYPVIIIPPGVRKPVAAKRSLTSNGRNLITVDDVYIRTLSANGTPSSAKIKWNDWDGLVNICFDNREADIGRFLRRHLGSVTPEMIQGLFSLMSVPAEPEPDLEDQLKIYLDEGKEILQQVLIERGVEIPPHGSWETAFFITGAIPEYSTNEIFYNLIASHNPRHTGWPIWLDSRGFSQEEHPYVRNGHWEAFINHLDLGRMCGIDFMRLSPSGKFYLYRGLEDDFVRSQRSPAPGTKLEFVFPIVRVAEAISVGINFAKGMGCDPETTDLPFAFRWSGLSKRELSSWAHPLRMIPQGRTTYQDQVISYQNIPLNTPISAIGNYVYQATKPLLESFGGFSLNSNTVETLVSDFFDRKL